ncbi:MAG TPA: DUF4235 domain-containing protein [Gemmatimonadaceae bacterium]|jgi:hypothetical protein|nr:DUF4235 domain-containing protein [Gemmatimonadaceae bacterium]
MKKKLQRKATQKVGWMIVGAGAAMLASSLVEKSLAAGWKAATSKSPPSRPESLKRTGWKEAIAWTAASALAVGLSQVLAKRGAAAGWQYATGSHPPV